MKTSKGTTNSRRLRTTAIATTDCLEQSAKLH